MLDGQVALITGGSRGIGAAIARRFASEGAKVVVNFRSHAEAAAQTVAMIEAEGGTAIALQADVSRDAEVKAMIATVLERLGQIDTLVCNAGIIRDQLAVAMSNDEFDSVLQVNLRGSFLCIREVLPGMMQARSGSILNIASVQAESGGSGQCNYATSKAGLLALTRSLALEMAPRNVRINAISPGMIETEMTRPIRDLASTEILRRIPMRRFGLADEVANAAVFLSSPQASYITGADLLVSGGLGL